MPKTSRDETMREALDRVGAALDKWAQNSDSASGRRMSPVVRTTHQIRPPGHS